MAYLSADEGRTQQVSHGNHSIAVYIDPDLEQFRPFISEKILDLCARFDDAFAARNVTATASTQAVKDETASKIKRGLGLSDPDFAGFSDAYDEALESVEQWRTVDLGVKRIFVYDYQSAIEHAKNSEKYLKYDARKDRVDIAWTLSEATKRGDAKDFPVIVVVRSSVISSPERQIASSIKKYEEIEKSLVGSDFNRRVYRLLRGTIATMIASKYAGLPEWYKAGLVEGISISIAGEFIGLNSAAGAFAENHPLVANDRNYELEEFYAWKGEDGKLIHPNLLRASTDAVLRAEIQKKNAAAEVLKAYKNESKTEASSSEILEWYSKEAGVDFNKILVEALPRKSQ